MSYNSTAMRFGWQVNKVIDAVLTLCEERHWVSV